MPINQLVKDKLITVMKRPLMPIKLSVIIVTYNSSYIIAKCLNELITAIPVGMSEIIVVDNASGDKTLEILASYKDKIELISLDVNIGFAGGVNVGISGSKGAYVLIINPDVIVNSECIEGLASFLSRNENVAIVGPKLTYQDGRTQPSRRRYPNLRAIMTHRIVFLKRIFGKKILSNFLMEDISDRDPAEVEWLIGGCMMLRRGALDDIGLFDSKFFLYYEDTDWCYRAAQKGWKVFYLPQLMAIHLYQRESKGINRQLIWHIMSLLRLYYKYGFRF